VRTNHADNNFLTKLSIALFKRLKPKLNSNPADALPNPATAPLAKRVGGDVALRILPLGDALTYGGDSGSGSNSYRLALRDILATDGNPVDMVGSQKAGSMADSDVEGWPGLTVSELSGKAKAAVPEYLPNLVLINAGTADCEGASKDVSGVKDTMLEILQFTWKNSIKSTIILSTVPPSGDAETDKCIEEVNSGYRSLVAEQQAISKKVVLVDFSSGLAQQEVGTDDGYKKMADIWFGGIKDAASRGWVEKPEGQFTEGPSTPTSKDKVSETASPASSTSGAGGKEEDEADETSGGSSEENAGSGGSGGTSPAEGSSGGDGGSKPGSGGVRVGGSWLWAACLAMPVAIAMA